MPSTDDAEKNRFSARARRYANVGLMSIATGLAIIGFVCISDAVRHSVADAVARMPRPSGRFRRFREERDG